MNKIKLLKHLQDLGDLFKVFILLPLKKSESAGVGQPVNLNPPASLNLFKLSCFKRRTSPGSNSRRLLGIFTLFERSQYILSFDARKLGSSGPR